MIIASATPEPYEVDDYDITFTSGIMMTLSVAKSIGDTVDFETSPLAVQFHLVAKPSTTDPTATLPAEDITVMMRHVLTIAHRTRTVTPPTVEERDLFQQTLLKMGKTVQ